MFIWIILGIALLSIIMLVIDTIIDYRAIKDIRGNIKWLRDQVVQNALDIRKYKK